MAAVPCSGERNARKVGNLTLVGENTKLSTSYIHVIERTDCFPGLLQHYERAPNASPAESGEERQKACPITNNLTRREPIAGG